MADAADSNGNGRVTLALIGQKLDDMADDIKDIKAGFTRHDDRIGSLERGQETRKTQIDNIRENVNELKSKSERWSVLNSIGALVAALLASMGLSR